MENHQANSMNATAHLSIPFCTFNEVGLQSGVRELGDRL